MGVGGLFVVCRVGCLRRILHALRRGGHGAAAEGWLIRNTRPFEDADEAARLEEAAKRVQAAVRGRATRKAAAEADEGGGMLGALGAAPAAASSYFRAPKSGMPSSSRCETLLPVTTSVSPLIRFSVATPLTAAPPSKLFLLLDSADGA